MKNIFKSLKLAITSRLNYKCELTELQKKRLTVCNTCPFNSNNVFRKSFKDNIMISLNKFLDSIFGIININDAICTKCGCNLLHKSTQEAKENMCELGKWDNIK